MLSRTAMTQGVAREILGLTQPADVDITFLQPSNHVWRIAAGDATWYVKAHTKSWYGDSRVGAARTVQHEAIAYQILAAHGLAVPAAIAAESRIDNPLGWPYLCTRELPGAPLPQVLRAACCDADRDAALETAGRFLAAMHALRFDHPGYLTDGPPATDPDPERWQHPIWTFGRFLQGSIRTWADDLTVLSPAVMDGVMALFTRSQHQVADAYTPPRFTHGDCHASAIFLDRAGPAWTVTGVLDLEVASAGNPLFDLNKMIIELTGHFRSVDYDWWTPLFRGYGQAPDFDSTRLILLASAHDNYACLGKHSWGMERPGIVRHILESTTWRDLFHPSGS